jgi:hypothetical protein
VRSGCAQATGLLRYDRCLHSEPARRNVGDAEPKERQGESDTGRDVDIADVFGEPFE